MTAGRGGGVPTVVIATRNRRERLLTTLQRLRRLPERPPLVVVDNASTDGSAEAARQVLGVEVIDAGRNRGAAGRTLGVRAATTAHVAFADDDSWWAPGSLAYAGALLDDHPRVAVAVARVIADGRDDPLNERLRHSPLAPTDGQAGVPVLGFLACAAVVRRAAYLQVGGFDERFMVGGEEELLALDLAAAGWDVVYVERMVVHHEPAAAPRSGRRRREARNQLWTTWLRRRGHGLITGTAPVLRRALHDPATRSGVGAAVAGLPWVLSERRPLPRHVEAARRRLD